MHILSPERHSSSHESQEPQGVNHQELNVPDIPAGRHHRVQVADAGMTQNQEVPLPRANQVQPRLARLSLPSFTQRLLLYNVQDVVGNTCGAFFVIFPTAFSYLLLSVLMISSNYCEPQSFGNYLLNFRR